MTAKIWMVTMAMAMGVWGYGTAMGAPEAADAEKSTTVADKEFVKSQPGVPISVEDLPKGTMEAIKAKYPDAVVAPGRKDAVVRSTNYGVMITSKGKTLGLYLDEAGKLLKAATVNWAPEEPDNGVSISAENLPKGTMDAIKAQYPDAVVVEGRKDAVVRLTSYGVLIITKEIETYLFIDEAGQVAKAVTASDQDAAEDTDDEKADDDDKTEGGNTEPEQDKASE